MLAQHKFLWGLIRGQEVVKKIRQVKATVLGDAPAVSESRSYPFLEARFLPKIIASRAAIEVGAVSCNNQFTISAVLLAISSPKFDEVKSLSPKHRVVIDEEVRGETGHQLPPRLVLSGGRAPTVSWPCPPIRDGCPDGSCCGRAAVMPCTKSKMLCGFGIFLARSRAPP